MEQFSCGKYVKVYTPESTHSSPGAPRPGATPMLPTAAPMLPTVRTRPVSEIPHGRLTKFLNMTSAIKQMGEDVDDTTRQWYESRRNPEVRLNTLVTVLAAIMAMVALFISATQDEEKQALLIQLNSLPMALTLFVCWEYFREESVESTAYISTAIMIAFCIAMHLVFKGFALDNWGTWIFSALLVILAIMFARQRGKGAGGGAGAGESSGADAGARREMHHLATPRRRLFENSKQNR